MLLSEAENLYYWVLEVYIKCPLFEVTMIGYFFFLHNLVCCAKSSLSCYLVRPVSLMI